MTKARITKSVPTTPQLLKIAKTFHGANPEAVFFKDMVRRLSDPAGIITQQQEDFLIGHMLSVMERNQALILRTVNRRKLWTKIRDLLELFPTRKFYQNIHAKYVEYGNVSDGHREAIERDHERFCSKNKKNNDDSTTIEHV